MYGSMNSGWSGRLHPPAPELQACAVDAAWTAFRRALTKALRSSADCVRVARTGSMAESASMAMYLDARLWRRRAWPQGRIQAPAPQPGLRGGAEGRRARKEARGRVARQLRTMGLGRESRVPQSALRFSRPWQQTQT